ncbi:MAG TPA: transposase, partial [Solirubrobacteraceae bacterium]|nr:transposase [Solirubrobacteraceae bacterium]
GAVEQMDLSAFYGAYRANGQGRAAYDPAVMGLLLYSYASGVSSSRQIERCCEVDVAFKVITAMRVPDHSTIAEFRRRHQDAIAGVFVEVLALCAEAGAGEGRGDRDRWDEDPGERRGSQPLVCLDRRGAAG